MIGYEFGAKLWRANAASAWHFVTLPKDIAARIRTVASGGMNAFGSLRIKARIGRTAWKTSLFMDTKLGSFVLPVKAEVRRAEKIADGDTAQVHIEIEL